MNHLMQLNQLSEQAVRDVAHTFNNLPATDHADGNYRLRRYSIIRFYNETIEQLPQRSFVQTDDINHFQGNVARQFEPLEETLLQSGGMQEICRIFKENNSLSDYQDIEIHQIRVVTLDEVTQVAPEGVHQDGFDRLGIFSIGRHNVDGGNILIYKDFDSEPFFSMAMETGNIAMLDDSQLWHNAKPIKRADPEQQGYMDVFVLTAKESH